MLLWAGKWSTKQKVVATKLYIKKNYKNQMKSLQKREEWYDLMLLFRAILLLRYVFPNI